MCRRGFYEYNNHRSLLLSSGLSSPRMITGFQENFARNHYGTRGTLCEAERIQDFALQRINVSALGHSDIFFWAFWEKCALLGNSLKPLQIGSFEQIHRSVFSQKCYPKFSKNTRNSFLGTLSSMHQIQRILLGRQFDFSVICQIAFFLEMQAKELTSPSLTIEQIQQEQNSHNRYRDYLSL